jgi:hypothetical protein
MDGTTEIGQRPPDEDPLREPVERFRAAWRANGSADLDAFLPQPGDSLRGALLDALVKVDLEMRWRRREAVTLEHYAERYPELAPGDNWSPELLYEEYRVRQQYGDGPSLVTYQKRFPRQFDQLRRLVAANPVGTLLASGPPQRPVRRAPAPPVVASQTPEVPSNTSLSEPSEPAAVPPAQPPQPPPGLQTPTPGPPPNSDYRLEKLIGRGGFGEVWRALAPGGLAVAVKIIDRPADHEARVREERALDVIKQLKHHFLVQTHAYWAAADRLFIVMDLAEGSLRDRLVECRKAGQRGVPHAELLRYFREASEALDYLHKKGVLHRDIKPDNLLVVEGHMRLADFGLARSQTQLMVSVSGSGTPAYMAPEMWRGHAGPASDLYSLAYSYAELRLGRRPFTSSDYAAVMFDHLEHTPDLGNLPQAEKAVLLKALAKKPTERYATCTEFARALEAAAAPSPAVPATLQHGERGPQTAPATPTQVDGGAPPRTEQEVAGSRPSATNRIPSDVIAPPPPVHKPRRRVVTMLLMLLLPVAAGVAVAALLKYWRPQPPSLELIVSDKLSVQQGGQADLEIKAARTNFEGAFRLHFATSAGLHVQDQEVAPGKAAVKVTVTADRSATQDNAFVEVDAEGDKVRAQARVRVEVLPAKAPGPALWLPADGDDGGKGKDTDIKGREFYKEVIVTKQGAPSVRFILVPQGPNDPLPTYYMMKYKVSNGLFAAWRKEKPPAGAGADWARLPAVGMRRDEAAALATWLGGQLPSLQQWDKAAALDRRPDPKNAAVGRGIAEPRPVDDCDGDQSPLGIGDLLGNGTEFTREPPIKEEVKDKGAKPRDLVILRGQRWMAAGPLTLKALEEQQKDLPQVQFADRGSPFTGFRVVLEPPREPPP